MGFFDKIKAGLTKTRMPLATASAACFPAVRKSMMISMMSWRRA